MFPVSLKLRNKNAIAWDLMILTVGLHVFDEDLTDFPGFYNSLVLELQKGLGFFPVPVISHRVWLGGLISVVIIGFALTPLVNRGRGFFRILTTVLGANMIAKALVNLLGSLFFGRLLPGFWSSPFLLAAAVFAVVRGIRGKW